MLTFILLIKGKSSDRAKLEQATSGNIIFQITFISGHYYGKAVRSKF